MNTKLIKRIGIDRKIELEHKAYILIHDYIPRIPKLIDETKRNYIFSHNGTKIYIPKKELNEK